MAADVADYSREAPSLMVHGKGNKDRVVPLHPTAQAAFGAYLATRHGLRPEHPLFVSWRGSVAREFTAAADRVLAKNADLYRRLA